jgi:hypothetical protein
MHGILKDILTTVAEQDLLLRDSVYLTQTHGHNTFLTLVVNASVETQV